MSRRLVSLVATTVAVVGVAAGCAFPKKVKENAAAQLALVETVQTTTTQMEAARVGSLGETAAIVYEGGVAEACLDLETAALPQDRGARTRAIARRLAEAGTEKAADYRAARSRAATEFEVLRLRLALMHRAQSTIKDYVDTDITIDEDKLHDMEEAAKALHPNDSAGASAAEGGKPE